MKVIYHPDFTRVYTQDPAAQAGRMEAVLGEIQALVEFLKPSPALKEQISLAHDPSHIEHVEAIGLYDIASLAAGGAVLAARTALKEFSFGLLRPPGHHASRSHSWGFCYFNNMAIALLSLRQERLIKTALVLDIDLHFGDGTVNILGEEGWVRIHNPSARSRELYLEEVQEALKEPRVDIIGISAGFDFHQEDWGGLLSTKDYETIGRLAGRTARNWKAGCFAILEGGYNLSVLGRNVRALLEGMADQG
jgi:acetoin utilization deacetylase AcuC-like enzyme